jgi:hypothetical protein
MKRKASALTRISALLIASLLVTVVPSIKADTEAPQLQWEKTYPRPASTIQNVSATHYDIGSCFIQTSDGGYAVVGNTKDHAYWGPHGGFGSTYSAIMIKTDSSGNVQWQKTDSGFYNALAIFQTHDQGYFMVLQRGVLLMLDSQGNVLSNKTLGMSLAEVQLTSSGDYLFITSSGNDAIMSKTDSSGDLLWNKTLYTFPNTFSNSITVSNIAISSDGNYLIAGWSSVFINAIGKGEPNLWLLKVDSNGNLLFSKGFSYDANAGIDENPAVIGTIFIAPTRDGGSLLVGSGGWSAGSQFPFLVKLASNGDWQWNRSYPNDPTFLTILSRAILSSAIQTSDGKFVAVGSYPSSGINKVLLIKVDENGNLLWNQTFNSSVDLASATSILTTEGGFLVLGSLDGNVWLAKFAAESGTPPAETPVPFSTAILVAFIVIVIIVVGIGICLLVYFKKRRH